MKWIGVITGDIVGSSEILKAGERDKLLEVMKGTVEEINTKDRSEKIKMEIYRGDSFQIRTTLDKPHHIFKMALAFRAKLIAHSNNSSRWDARLGIGIGESEFITKKIRESDGEAFHLSGEAFDKLDKNSRIAILTPNQDFNEELAVSTAFVDDIITNWTPTQANLFYIIIMRQFDTQKDIAKMLGVTPQAVNKVAISSKAELIFQYMTRVMTKTADLLIEELKDKIKIYKS